MLVANDLNNKKVKQIFLFVLLTFIYFLLFYVYRNSFDFLDEGENMLGGMVIANGGLLYKDFITQHTPVMYYLCAIYRILGADMEFFSDYIFILPWRFYLVLLILDIKKISMEGY